MRPIPSKLRAELAEDPEYAPQWCIWHQSFHGHGVRVQWHHQLIFAGRQVNERFCIMQICEEIHRKAEWKQVRERLDWIMLNRATDEELEMFSKSRDLVRKRQVLNEIYGETYQKE